MVFVVMLLLYIQRIDMFGGNFDESLNCEKECGGGR